MVLLSKILNCYAKLYMTGPVKIDYLSANKLLSFLLLLYHNLITIYTTATISSLLQNLMGFLLQLTEMGYYILNGRYCTSENITQCIALT